MHEYVLLAVVCLVVDRGFSSMFSLIANTLAVSYLIANRLSGQNRGLARVQN